MTGYKRLGFIGCGNMAEALCRGVLNAGLYKADSLTAFDISPERRELFNSLGVTTAEDNTSVITSSDAVILAVKPQHMSTVLEETAGRFREEMLVISIAAGIGTSAIEKFAPQCPVVRVMPNTPFLMGLGASAVSGGTYADDKAVSAVLSIMKTGGIAVEVDEKHMDAVTALSGSGPAYFFYFAELFLEAARLNGLDDSVARGLLFQTVKGAAAMLAKGDRTPEELRKQVTSPGGTTEAAIKAFNDTGLRDTLIRGFNAAVKRSEELRAKED